MTLYGVETHQSYGASPAIWDHSVTCHPTQVNAPRLNPSHVGRYSMMMLFDVSNVES